MHYGKLLFGKNGIKVDPLGYWNKENDNKPVIIPTNKISTKNLSKAILGISNTGDIKIMQPGADFTFQGDYVTELPTAQAGATKSDDKQKYIVPDVFFSTFGDYDEQYALSQELKNKPIKTLADIGRQKVVNIAKRRAEGDEVTELEGSAKGDPNVCIKGVCSVYNEAGVQFKGKNTDKSKQYQYNPYFAENFQQEGFEEVPVDQPVKPGDFLQKYGLDDDDESKAKYRAVHAQILVDEELGVYDNYWLRNVDDSKGLRRDLRPKQFQKLRENYGKTDKADAYRVYRLSDKAAEALVSPEERQKYEEENKEVLPKHQQLTKLQEQRRAKLKEQGVPDEMIAQYEKLADQYYGNKKNLRKVLDSQGKISQDSAFALLNDANLYGTYTVNNQRFYNRYTNGGTIDKRMAKSGLQMNPFKKGVAAKKKAFSKAQAGLTSADQEIDRQFREQQGGLQSVARPQYDLSMQAATSLAPTYITPPPTPNPQPKRDMREGYQGLNPFVAGLAIADSLIKEPTPRYYTRPEDQEYYNPNPLGTGSQAIMKKGGKMCKNGCYDQGGEINLYDPSTSAKPISNSVVQFSGPSHEERNKVGGKGIPMSFGGKKVEVEGDETAYKGMDGSLHIMGNMKNPLTGRLFKNDGKIIADAENKVAKQMAKGMLLEEIEPKDPFDILAVNSGRAKVMGANAKQAELNSVKELFANIQQQKLNLAAQMNVDPLDLDKADFGKTMAQGGKKKPKRPYEEVDYSMPIPDVPQPQMSIKPPASYNFNPPGQQPQAPGFDYSIRTPEARLIESDARDMNPVNILPEIYALATNQVDPVQMQRYNPTLQQSYNVSFQDQINQNNSTFRALQQRGSGNPAAMATMAGQLYSANNAVQANQFRTNQALSAEVYNANRQTLNEAQRFNLGLQDQQYVRQEQARSNTRSQELEAFSSIADKTLQHTRDMNRLKTYENLYDYRYSPEYVAEYAGPDAQFNVPNIGGYNPATGRPYTPQEVQYYRQSQATQIKGPDGVVRSTINDQSNTPLPRRRGKAGASLVKSYKQLK